MKKLLVLFLFFSLAFTLTGFSPPDKDQGQVTIIKADLSIDQAITATAVYSVSSTEICESLDSMTSTIYKEDHLSSLPEYNYRNIYKYYTYTEAPKNLYLKNNKYLKKINYFYKDFHSV